jgi:hypothetical protein
MVSNQFGNPFSSTGYYRQAATRSPFFGHRRPQFGSDSYARYQQQSGGGIFSKLWNGAAVIGKGLAVIGVGLLSLKCFNPEWLKSIAKSAGELIEKYTPDSVIKFFEPATKAIKAQFADGGTLNKWLNTATDAVRGAFETVKSWFTSSSATKAATEKAKTNTATAAEKAANEATPKPAASTTPPAAPATPTPTPKPPDSPDGWVNV